MTDRKTVGETVRSAVESMVETPKDAGETPVDFESPVGNCAASRLHVRPFGIRIPPVPPRSPGECREGRMHRFSRFVRIAVSCLGACLLAGTASAQVHDHLRCFKIKDPSSFHATVDVRPLDDAVFSVEAGCTIKVKSRQVCFAVEKDLVTTDAPTALVPGAELSNAFLCYSMRCPSSLLPESLDMSDQFGTRTLTGFRTSTICAPAVIGDPPPTTTTTTMPHGPPRDCTDATAPNCDGTCGDPDIACIESSGACICQFYEPFFPCGFVEGPPECYGQCPGSKSCVDVSGTCQCADVFE